MHKLKHHINKEFSFLKKEKLFLAVSGGLDSMVLLSLFSKFDDLCVLHVNYKLRGKDSDLDEELVRSVCASLNVKCLVYIVSNLDKQKMKNGNLQLEARKIRYKFFENQTIAFSKSKILLAHHADDQVETFLLQLIRNSGISGLMAMKKKNKTLLRPLLPFKKKELKQFAEKSKLIWREDYSNQSLVYNRNRIRNVWIPLLEKDVPELTNSIAIIQDAFSQTLVEMQNDLNFFTKNIKEFQKLSFDDFDCFTDVFLVELFRELKILPSIIFELKKIRNSQKGTKINISSINSEYDSIIKESNCFFFQKRNRDIQTPKISIKKVDFLPENYNKKTIYLDKSKLKGKLVIRKWEIGDRIKPIGLKGSKLISDVLTEAKVPNNSRGNNWVVMDDEKLLWCIGFSVDRRAIANSKSPHILKVSLA
ncbi:MAG: tRNA lysidine(34) synthetase TilS [Crocinitomicaceae bacterium]|nr:tRNA lysidine(34) synthetase TilS [Crocinitomicaceae bacterium]